MPDLKIEIVIQKVRIYNNKSADTTEFGHSEDINIDISFINRNVTSGIRVNIAVLDKFENVIFIARKVFEEKNENNFTLKIEGGKLIPNTYVLSVAIDTPSVELYDLIKGGIQLSIIETGHENFLAGDLDNGIITPPVIWM